MLKEIKMAVNTALLPLNIDLVGRYVEKEYSKPSIFTDCTIIDSKYTSELRCENWIAVKILLRSQNRDEVFLYQKSEEILNAFKTHIITEIGVIPILDKTFEMDTDQCFSLCILTLKYITYDAVESDSIEEIEIRNGGKKWDYRK